ncbi:MAG: hypothetical protein R3D78_03885 [Paracoccaceae bacterium]
MFNSETETLTEVRGDLVLAALCIGQFQAPCQIDPERILVRTNEPLLMALGALGLTLRAVVEQFTPAPLFVPESELLAQAARSHESRRVRTHVARYHGADPEEDEDEAAEAPPAQG